MNNSFTDIKIPQTNKCIITNSGKLVDPMTPQLLTEEDLPLEDIANSLKYICRYTGHCNRFYSVLEHSFLVGKILEHRGYSDRVILRGLLHDASEAYLADINKVVKSHPKLLGIVQAHNVLQDRIFRLYYCYPMLNLGELTSEGDTAFDEGAYIKEADCNMLYIECEQLMPKVTLNLIDKSYDPTDGCSYIKRAKLGTLFDREDISYWLDWVKALLNKRKRGLALNGHNEHDTTLVSPKGYLPRF